MERLEEELIALPAALRRLAARDQWQTIWTRVLQPRSRATLQFTVSLSLMVTCFMATFSLWSKFDVTPASVDIARPQMTLHIPNQLPAPFGTVALAATPTRGLTVAPAPAATPQP